MPSLKSKLAWIALLGLLLPLASCVEAPPQKQEPETPMGRLQRLANEAAQRSSSAGESDNEIRAIEYRRHVMGRAGLQLYVVLFNDAGQPIDYFVTKGKCASSRKRLTKPWEFQTGQTGIDSDGKTVEGDFVMATSSEDGTWGESDPYIFCKTADGRYKQFNGPYYASDAPIEVTIKPLIVDTSGKNQQQQ